jgi:hypothetical protein
MMMTARDPIVFDPGYLVQGRAVASELMSALPRLHNLRELSVERPSNNGCPEFDRVFTAVAVVGPQLTRLRLENIRMLEAETVVTSVSPWSQYLRHLVLHVEGSSYGDEGKEGVLDCLVHRLIAPARKTLEDLELHVYMPEFHPITPNNTSSQEKWISTMFTALSEVHFPRLRGFSVRTPFCSPPTQSEGAPLVRFIQAHALERLDVGIARVTSVTVHSTAVDPTAEYYRFLSLLTPTHGTCLRELSLHTPPPRQPGQGVNLGLSVISNFMSTIRVPLADLAIHGVALHPEWTQIMGVTPSFARTLCSLRLPMATVTPETFMAVASALPSLQVLDIKTPELLGTTRRVQVSNNSATDRRRAVDADRAKWVQESGLDFLHDIQIQECWHLSLRRLRIRVLRTFGADHDYLDILQPALPAFGRGVPTLSEAIIETVDALQFYGEAAIGLTMS